MKKILSGVLALIVILSAFTPAFGAPSNKDLYEQSGEILKNAGVLQGSETGDLMLNQKLKRQDMVVLVSRLYKEENAAKKYPVKNNFKDVKNAYYKPFISWAVDKELILGMTKDTFGFDGTVTVQQFQTLLLRALGYGEEAKDWKNVPKLSETLGLMEDLSPSSNQSVDRGLMAAMTVNALRTNIKGSSIITLAQKLSVDVPELFNVDAVATVDGNTLKLEGIAKGTNALKVNLKPVSSDITTGEINKDIPLREDGRFSTEITNLQSGKYEYKFASGKLTTPTKFITIAELPFELIDAKANNLKEIALNFTAPVDKISSSFLSNYFTNAGSIKSARLEDNGTTVILTLSETMQNQRKYKISINKIKSDKGKEISTKDIEFTAFDNEIPKVKDVKPLGNIGLRIYLTEPVKTPRTANFKIDGKSFSGQVDSVVDNVITLKYISSYYAPKEGKHTLTVSSLEDYAGYKGIDQGFSFDVIKDTEAPKIVDAKATIEKAIIQFDEEIDPDSKNRNNFYWKSGSLKRYPNSIEVLNDEVILNFSENTLPTYEVSIYIDSIADYSGNKLRNDEVRVTPEVDMTPPEVMNVTVSEDGKSITVYYSKAVEAKNRAFYTIEDKNNRTVNIRSVEGSGREYVINLNAPLPVGANTIDIQDVYDTTALKNRLIPYTQQINMDDVEKPTIVSHSGSDRDIMLLFSKEMDLSTTENHENYLINLDGRWTYLPKDTEFDLIYDDKTLLINLPEKIGGKKVDIGRSGSIREMQVMGLKAINGVLIEPTIVKFDGTDQGEAKAEKAELIEPDTIKVTFNQPINSASARDFSLSDRNINRAIADGNIEVTLILDDKDETSISGNLEINRNNSIGTILNTGVKPSYVSITDKVPPRVEDNVDRLYISGNTIELPFTEKLEDKISTLFKKDLRVEDANGNVLDESDYETSLDRYDSTINITIKGSIRNPYGYSVRLVDEPKYIMDTSGNVVEPSNYDYYTD